jgi:hypothetical protein
LGTNVAGGSAVQAEEGDEVGGRRGHLKHELTSRWKSNGRRRRKTRLKRKRKRKRMRKRKKRRRRKERMNRNRKRRRRS